MRKKEKIALVIEGGGFKSVFSAGVLDAFLMNKFNPFDIYIGVSSGAMCLTYYISNQYKSYFSLSKEVSVNEKFLSYTPSNSNWAIYIIDLHGKERKYQGNFLLIR